MLDVKRILSPTDFSDASRHALKLAVSIAERLGAEIVLLHVVPPVPHLPASSTYHFDVLQYEGSLRSEAAQELAVLAATVKGVAVRTMLASGDPAESILRAVEENQIDWIVIATAGRTGWERVLFGSVAEKVVRRATCPVLTLRNPAAGSPSA